MKLNIKKTVHKLVEFPINLLKFINGNLYKNAIKVFKIGPYNGYVVNEIFRVLNSSEYKTSLQKINELETIIKRASEQGEFEKWTKDDVRSLKTVSLAKWKSAWDNKYWHLQLFIIPKNHEHPAHFHYDLSSLFIVQKGSLRMREYEKVAIEGDVITLKEMRNEILKPFMSSISSELYRNAHYFSTEEDSVIGLNFNIRGYENIVADKKKQKNAGRRYIDISNQVIEGDIIKARIATNIKGDVNSEL